MPTLTETMRDALLLWSDRIGDNIHEYPELIRILRPQARSWLRNGAPTTNNLSTNLTATAEMLEENGFILTVVVEIWGTSMMHWEITQVSITTRDSLVRRQELLEDAFTETLTKLGRDVNFSNRADPDANLTDDDLKRAREWFREYARPV